MWLEGPCARCARSTPSAVMGLFPHAAPYSSPDPVGISAGKGGRFSFQSTNFFYEAKMFPFYSSCSPAAMFSYTHCTFHVIYYRLPRESIPQPKKKKKFLTKYAKSEKGHVLLTGFP